LKNARQVSRQTCPNKTLFAKRFRLLNSSKRRVQQDSARLMLMPLPNGALMSVAPNDSLLMQFDVRVDAR